MFRCYTAVSQTRFTFRYTATVFDKLRGATARPCGISTELSGAITTEFCFACTLEGVTAMPSGLHVGLCHALLV